MATIALTIWDYAIFFAFIVTSLGIGIFFAYSGKKAGTEEYFLAGRDIHYLPVAISLIVSFQSSVLMLGTPAEVYIYGISHVLSLLGDLPCMLLLNVISVPLFYKMGLTSIFQYVKRRFVHEAEVLRLFLVFLGMLFTIIYTGLVFLGPAYAIQALTGFPVWATIVGSSLVAVVYTSIGGMKAVIWTDMFQFIIMVAGMLAVFIKGTADVGGLGKVFAISSKYGRTDAFDFNPNPWIRHTFWTLLIGSFFRQMLLLFSQQTMQRLNSTRTPSDAKKVVYVFIPFVAAMQLIADGTGLVAFSYYAKDQCDPLASGRINNPNQVFIALMTDLFHSIPCVTGLVTAALLGASLSTVSSTLNGLAANTCEEFLKHKMLSDTTNTIVAKLSVVGYGILATLIALAMTFVKGSLSQIFVSILGSVGAPMVGMFLLAIFRKRIAVNSVTAGGFVGLVVSLWMSMGYSFSTTLPETPWLPPGPTNRCNIVHDVENLYDLLASANKSENIATTGNISVFTDDQININKATVIINESTGIWSTNDSITNNAVQGGKLNGLDNLYSLSYQYFAVISTLVTIVVGCAVNVCIGRQARSADYGTTVSCIPHCLKKRRGNRAITNQPQNDHRVLASREYMRNMLSND